MDIAKLKQNNLSKLTELRSSEQNVLSMITLLKKEAGIDVIEEKIKNINNEINNRKIEDIIHPYNFNPQLKSIKTLEKEKSILETEAVGLETDHLRNKKQELSGIQWSMSVRYDIINYFNGSRNMLFITAHLGMIKNINNVSDPAQSMRYHLLYNDFSDEELQLINDIANSMEDKKEKVKK